MNKLYIEVQSLYDVPSGLYQLQYENAVDAEETVSRAAGGGLFGFTERQEPALDRNKRSVYFYWGAEASMYFAFDNVLDEVRVGLRHVGASVETIRNEATSLLSDVGLHDISEEAHVISPWELSGGQQQRLLAGVILSRRVRAIVAFTPLVYVQESDRPRIYTLIGRMMAANGGTFIIVPEPGALPPRMFGTLRLKVQGMRPQVAPGTYRMEPALPARADAQLRPPEPHEELLVLQDIAWRYDNRLTGITIPKLRLLYGQVYVVCGPNGAGKSSMFRAMMSTWSVPASSLFRFRGRDVRNPFKELVRSGEIAFVLQDPNLHVTGGTIGKYLAYSRVSEGIMQALKLENYLEDDLLSSPLWVRQMSVVATVLCSGSKLILLDEPIDGIAYEIVGRAAVKLIRAIAAAGSTVLIITHNPDLARQCGTLYIWVQDGIARLATEGGDGSSDGALRHWLYAEMPGK